MKHERLKSYILSCLITSSLILSAYLWVSEELWPSGFDFFDSVKQNSVVRALLRIEEPYSIPKENLSKPQKVVVTNGAYRYVYYNTDDNFDRIFSDVKGFLTDFFSEDSMISKSEVVSEDEWYNVLRNDELLDTRSVYIDYSLDYSSTLFAQVIGAKDTWLDKSLTVREFIIAPLDEGGANMIFYIRDSQSGIVTKYYVKYEKQDIYGNILQVEGGESSGYLFSFELNLDKSESDTGVGTGVAQKVFLDSLVLISPYPQENAVIESENPLAMTQERDNLVSAFSYNPASLKRHVDSSGTEHYVDNYSTLKIYSNGLIEYTALDKSRGIRVAEQSSSLYEMLNSAIEFSEGVWKAILPDEPLDVLVTSNLISPDEGDGAFIFTLDYYFEGTPVATSIGGVHDMQNAIEIKMEGGVITEYRHLIRRFKKTGEEVVFATPVEALNGIYNNLFDMGDEVTIEDFYVTYRENGVSAAVNPVWCVKIAGRQKPIFYAP